MTPLDAKGVNVTMVVAVETIDRALDVIQRAGASLSSCRVASVTSCWSAFLDHRGQLLFDAVILASCITALSALIRQWLPSSHYQREIVRLTAELEKAHAARTRAEEERDAFASKAARRSRARTVQGSKLNRRAG